MIDKWDTEILSKEINSFVTSELRGVLTEDEINHITVNSGHNIQKAIYAINKIKERTEEKKALSLDFISGLFPETIDQEKALKILECLSMFNVIGYTDIYSQQSDVICGELLNLSRQDFDNIIEVLVVNNFIERSGSFIWVSSFQIDFILHFLKRNNSDSLIKFITVVEKADLGPSFGKQIIKLADYEDSKKIKQLISSNEGLINRIEFINSKTGSEIINNLVEVNPIETATGLLNTLSKRSSNELFELKIGRRNLVWALEKLAFRRETFSTAADILLLLAKAENEKLGNNSTQQLIELFQVMLAGTQAPLDERFNWITKHYVIEESQLILISCLDRALMTRNFIKMRGAETQAGKELQEIFPEHPDIQKYWSNVISLLTSIAIDDSSKNKEKACEILINRFNQQLLDGLSSEIISSIEKVVDKHKTIPKDLNQQFAYALSVDWNISSEYKKRIELILEKYKPIDIKDQLENIVKLPPYKAERVDGEIKDLAEIEARDLCKSLINEGNFNWLGHIGVLLEGEQRQSFSFGHEVGKIGKKLEEIISVIISEYLKIPFDNRNTSLLEGIVAGKSDESFTRWVIDSLLKNDTVWYHAIRLNRFLRINFKDVEKLFPIISKNPNYVVAFQYLDLRGLSDKELNIIISELLKAGEFGHVICTGILGEIIRKNPERYSQIEEIIDWILFQKDVLKANNQHFFLMMHYFDLAEVKLKNGSVELAKFISNEILEVCKEISVPNETYAVRLLRIVLDQYWKETWPLFGTQIISDTYEGWWNLKGFLEKYEFKNVEGLIDWVNQNLPLSARNIIQFIRFEQKDANDTDDWTEIVYQLINLAGEDEYFLSSLSARLHSYFTSGTALPIFNSRILLLKKLANHKFERVRQFSQVEIAHFENSIIEEKKWLENYNLRNKQ